MKKLDANKRSRMMRYAAVAGAIGAAGSANAQILYTDIADQTITPGNSYLLNLDNATGDDYVITCSSRSGSMSGFPYTGVGVVINTFGSNGVASASTSQGFTVAAKLNANDAINNSLGFGQAPASVSSSGLILGAVVNITGLGTFPIGDWLGASNKYLGLALDVSGSMHYGWARLDVNINGNSFTIKDYAVHLTAGSTILAGQQAVGVEELNVRDKVDMNINNKNLKINVLDPSLTNGVVTVTDISGKVVATYHLNGSNNSFDVSQLASGIYAINVVFDQGVAKEKLFINN
ncbi:MAG: T9SS type A sorting domain-containing protein [Flavobacteriales bacterium]